MILRRQICATVVLLFALIGGIPSLDAAGSTPMFRVFLKDGTPLVCWGEYARVGDNLVLTVPIGTGARTTYEFVSIAVTRIDMIKTERYAESVRAAQFAATRGKVEYAELSDRLAAQLSAIGTLGDPKQRLTAAEGARQQLIDWASGSHGYRAKEVQQMLQMFDSAINDLRVAAGESRFSLNLSGGMIPAEPMALRNAPTARETVDLALKAAAAADSEETKRSLLRRARTVAAALPKGDPRNVKLKTTVDHELAAAIRLQAAYSRMDHDIRLQAGRAVDRGDVLAVDALRDRITKTDRLLGRQRPADVASLMEWLDHERDAAAEQRLVLDHWESLRGQIVDYQKSAATLIRTLDSLNLTLVAITKMTGPPLTTLVMAERQTTAVSALYGKLVVPEGVETAHSLFGLAVEQADVAVRTRHRAVDERKLAVARDAAAAANDARTRLAQAKEALLLALKPPKAIR